MASEWPIQPLHQVARELTVGYVGTMADQYVAEGVLFLRSLNIRSFGLDLSDVKYVSAEFHSTIRKSALEEGDVVIVRTGRPGTCAVIPSGLGPLNCSDLVIVRCGPKLRPHFLCYWVNAMAGHHVTAHAVGAVQQHFNVGSAKLIELPVPPLKDQDEVLGVLRALDERIDNLRQTNANLEAIAEALFKSWFVDFDPVHANAEGREPEGMDAATAILFPSEFEDSEIGPIPKDWQVEQIGKMVSCLGGATPSTKDESFWQEGSHCWATPKDLSGLQSPVLVDTDRRITDAGLSKISSGLLPAGTLLLSSRAPIGYLAISAVPTAINQGFIAMPPGGELSPLFLLCWCKESMGLIKQSANGSTFMEISKKAFRPLPVCVPPAEVRDAFDQLAAPILDKIKANEQHRCSLIGLRDTLLPRLISGRMKVNPTQEGAVEAEE